MRGPRLKVVESLTHPQTSMHAHGSDMHKSCAAISNLRLVAKLLTKSNDQHRRLSPLSCQVGLK